MIIGLFIKMIKLNEEIELTRFFEMKQKNKFLAELYAK